MTKLDCSIQNHFISYLLIENIVLRIPILYGDVQYLDESAITTLFKKLLDESKTPVEMSDYEIRRPANVNDIAAIINDLVKQSVDDEKVGFSTSIEIRIAITVF